ncbi:MAG: ferrous iron transport protein A [Wenzhouxiangella sp.]
MTLNLKQLAVGDTGRVTGFGEGARSYRRKLLALGLTPGTELTVTRYAPMGDPVEIKVRGFSLSLRKDEAASLLVEKSN